MTENEWVTCVDPARMYTSFWGQIPDWKLRLFLCACVRREWPSFPTPIPWVNDAVQVAERFALGDSGVESLQVSATIARAASVRVEHDFVAAFTAARGKYRRHIKEAVAVAARSVAATLAVEERLWIPGYFPSAMECGGDELQFRGALAIDAEVTALFRRHIDLFRDVIGNPFHPVSFDQPWRTPEVISIATKIHSERLFDMVPILGDALIDAGCVESGIIDHCGAENDHVLGCWVVDSLLGRILNLNAEQQTTIDVGPEPIHNWRIRTPLT